MADTICIKNLRKEKPSNPYDIKVDRSSILGNPFFMKDESKRDKVCDKYEEYFQNKIKIDDAFKAEVNRLISIYKQYKKLNLFCWCFPLRCHAITIIAYIQTQIDMV